MMSLNQTIWDETIPMCTVFSVILALELFALFMMAKGLLKFDVPKWEPMVLLCLLPVCALIGSSRFRKWYIEHEKNS